jgi:glycosyltransferase involved in cell wall biosynthesis
MNDEKIRVLQVMDKCAIRGSPIHGVSRLLLTWWPAFQDTQVELSLCVLRGGGGTCDAFKNIGVVVQDLSRSKIDPRTIFELMAIIKRDNIHILHCHGYGATTFGRIAGFLSRTPVIVHEHMIDTDILWYQKAVDWLLSPLTAKGIAISNAVSEFMISKRAIPSESMEILYNCIPESYFRTFSDDEKTSTARKYNLDLNVPLIGGVGRLDPVKGHEDFLYAAQLVIYSYPNVKIVFVGEGEIRKKLEYLVERLEIDSHVIFLGHCNEVVDIIALFDVLVVSSHLEGFSLAAIEGMAQGKPIVATAVGGLPEVIDDGVTGLLVSPRKPEHLANAICKILDDVKLAETLASNGLEKCKKCYSAKVAAEKLVCLYQNILCE